jgi:hypothetical protein
VIATASNTAIATIAVGGFPSRVAFVPDGSKERQFRFRFSDRYGDQRRDWLSDPCWHYPRRFRHLYPTATRFAGTPGKANCYGQSVAALTQFGELGGAASALGFFSVGALQNAMMAYCGG